jgi:hypothetical protein
MERKIGDTWPLVEKLGEDLHMILYRNLKY